jgi:enoyl-CoA hydratase/carnithine racemase
MPGGAEGGLTRGRATEAHRHAPGLASARHLLLAGEDRAAYDELLTGLVEELAPAAELEAQLVRRLAAALWKQGRGDRPEVRLFARTATPKVIHRGRCQEIDADAASPPSSATKPR